MIDESCIDRLQSVNIESLAEQLGIPVRHHKCRCPFHEDKSPSLHFWPSVNGWKCFGCGAKGTNIDLVMRKEGIGFTEACRWIADRNGILIEYQRSNNKYQMTNNNYQMTNNNYQMANSNYQMTSIDYVGKSFGTGNTFCRSLVANGILTQEQLEHAAQTYRLGMTKDDGVVFWQIDQQMQPHDGKIMFYTDDCHRDRQHAPTWVSYRLKKKGELPREWQTQRCLFGLHLLDENTATAHPSIAIVESEKTAIICSEILADDSDDPTAPSATLWMATGGLEALSVELLRPLKGLRVVLFPDTDPKGEAFAKWSKIAAEAQRQLGQPFYVSPLLEQQASEEQKKQKIDLADYVLSMTE